MKAANGLVSLFLVAVILGYPVFGQPTELIVNGSFMGSIDGWDGIGNVYAGSSGAVLRGTAGVVTSISQTIVRPNLSSNLILSYRITTVFSTNFAGPYASVSLIGFDAQDKEVTLYSEKHGSTGNKEEVYSVTVDIRQSDKVGGTELSLRRIKFTVEAGFMDIYSRGPQSEVYVHQVSLTIVETVTTRQPPRVKEHNMSKGFDKTSSQPIDVTDKFSTADSEVYTFVRLENVVPPLDLSFLWIAPDGTNLKGDPVKITFAGAGFAYGVMVIEGFARSVGIWKVETYVNGELISKTLFTLQPALELVSKNLSIKEGQQIFPGDTLTATYEAKNTGKTSLKSVKFTLGGSLPKGVSLVEVTPPKDMPSGTTQRFVIKMKFENEGSYRVMVQAYVDQVLTEESPLIAQISPTPFWNNSVTIVGIMALIVAALAAVALLTKRKRVSPTGKETASIDAPVESTPSAPTATTTPRAQTKCKCGNMLTWVPQYQRFYCHTCKKYPPQCQVCKKDLFWVPEYDKYYCNTCGTYAPKNT